MKYFLYKPDTGVVVQSLDSSVELEDGAFAGLNHVPAGDFEIKDMPALRVVNGVLIKDPTYTKYVEAAEIKQYWESLDRAPILVFGFLLDCTTISETRINDWIESFDIQDYYPGECEILNGVKVVYWTYADNVRRPLAKNQLIAVRDEMINQRAIRRARLFRVYNDLKLRSNVTPAELYNNSTWN